MLAGDFSLFLQRHAYGGDFGIPELDAFAASLVGRLCEAGQGHAECAFALALSFHVKQLTEWDLLVVTNYGPEMHGSALAHGCEVHALPADRQRLAAFRKRPVTSGRIELDAAPCETQAWTALRAPAIRFLASINPADAEDLAGALVAGVGEGQQGGALLLLDSDGANQLAAAVRAALDAIIVCYWIEVQGPGEPSRVLTLLTAGIPAHEI